MNIWQEHNQKIIDSFRENGGKGEDAERLMLVTTTGAKTGQERIIPLIYVPYGKGVLAVASKGGNPKNPEWYHNLLAHPQVTVEARGEKFAATARVLSGTERERAFAHAVEVFPPYEEYQKKTSREIPLIALEPTRNS